MISRGEVRDGYGNTVATSGSTSSPYLFAATSGYRNDNDDGLMLVGARYYDPAVGLFITRDTDLSQPAYQYCNDDPINAVDPSGHGNPFSWFERILGDIILIISILLSPPVGQVAEGIASNQHDEQGSPMANPPIQTGFPTGNYSNAATDVGTSGVDMSEITNGSSNGEPAPPPGEYPINGEPQDGPGGI